MRPFFYIVISLLLFFGTMPLQAQHELILNKVCPILEDEPGSAQYEVEYEGKQVRLCCKKCIKMFQKNPMKWIERKDPQGNPYLPQFYDAGKLILKNTPTTETEKQNPVGAIHESPSSEKQEPESPPETKPTTSSKSGIDRFLAGIGTFHPLLVHFPIALIFCAFLLELRQTIQKKNTLSQSTKTLLIFGLFFTLFTVPTGWCIALAEAVPQTLSSYVEWHRWLGISTFIVLGTLVTLMSLWEENPKTIQIKILRVLLGILTGLVAWTGHYGGILTFGPDFFFPW